LPVRPRPRESPGFGAGSGVRLGLAQSGHAVPLFPLTAFFEDFHALKALEDAAFAAEHGGGTKASVLRHIDSGLTVEKWSASKDGRRF
jgi:hypothetical protein